jgi:hypothetical protein
MAGLQRNVMVRTASTDRRCRDPAEELKVRQVIRPAPELWRKR